MSRRERFKITEFLVEVLQAEIHTPLGFVTLCDLNFPGILPFKLKIVF